MSQVTTITLRSFILKKKKKERKERKKKERKMAASNGSKKFMFISHFLILLILALFFVPSYGGGFSFKAVSGGWGVARTLFGFIKGLASQDEEGKE